MDLEKVINEQVRFEWEETASAWSGGEKMIDQTFEFLFEDLEEDEETIQYANREIRRRYNQACDEYLVWLDKLGGK